jgi:hypothetical protein
MISVWWLLLIVPVALMVGLLVAAVASASGRASECERCPRVLEALREARRERCEDCPTYKEFARYLRADGAPENWIAAIPRAMTAEGWRPDFRRADGKAAHPDPEYLSHLQKLPDRLPVPTVEAVCGHCRQPLAKRDGGPTDWWCPFCKVWRIPSPPESARLTTTADPRRAEGVLAGALDGESSEDVGGTEPVRPDITTPIHFEVGMNGERISEISIVPGLQPDVRIEHVGAVPLPAQNDADGVRTDLAEEQAQRIVRKQMFDWPTPPQAGRE